MPLPAPQPHCRVAAKLSRYAARRAEIALSKALPRSLRPLQWVSHWLLRRPAHRSRRQPGRQIAIDGHRPQRPPRVPSLEAFGRRPSVPAETPRMGRHPKPFTSGEAVAAFAERLLWFTRSRPSHFARPSYPDCDTGVQCAGWGCNIHRPVVGKPAETLNQLDRMAGTSPGMTKWCCEEADRFITTPESGHFGPDCS